jgi:hypothetical protein
LDDRLGFVGTSGSGKTYNAGGAVERLLERRARVVIVDPLGVWYGLRLLADGKNPSGYDVAIFGGPHGDLPLTEHSGKLIGETVAGIQESCIVALDDLRTKAAERRFMIAFLEALYRKADGEPVHLVFDEADLWAPQKGSDEPQLLNLMEQIVRRGRIKGFIPWLISQRPAVISKDVLSQVDGLVAFKLTSSQDRQAIGAWIEGQADKETGKAILAELPTMQRGQGVVWVPGRGILQTVTFPAKTTFDSSRTPGRGEKRRTAQLKPLDLGALRNRLAAVDAEAKANDPKALKSEIAQLKAERDKLAKATTTASPTALEQAENAGYAKGYSRGKIDGYGEGIAGAVAEFDVVLNVLSSLEAPFKDLRTSAQRVQQWAARAAKSPPKLSLSPAVTSAPITGGAPRPPARVPRPAANPSPRASGDGSLTNPQRELLRSLAWWRAMGHDEPTRTQVAAIAGWKPKGSNLRNRLTELSSAGLVIYPREGLVQLTPTGIEHAPEPDISATLVESIRRICTPPMLTIFDALLAYRQQGAIEVSRDELATAIGWQVGGSNLRNRLTELSQIEAVEYPAKGTVALQEWVMEEHRAAA